MSLSDQHRRELAQGGKESWFQTTCPASHSGGFLSQKEHVQKTYKYKKCCMVENKNYPVVLLQVARPFSSALLN